MHWIGEFFPLLAFLLASVDCRLLKDEAQCGLVKLCGNKPGVTELDILECVQRHKVSKYFQQYPRIDLTLEILSGNRLHRRMSQFDSHPCEEFLQR